MSMQALQVKRVLLGAVLFLAGLLLGIPAGRRTYDGALDQVVGQRDSLHQSAARLRTLLEYTVPVVNATGRYRRVAGASQRRRKRMTESTLRRVRDLQFLSTTQAGPLRWSQLRIQTISHGDSLGRPGEELRIVSPSLGLTWRLPIDSQLKASLQPMLQRPLYRKARFFPPSSKTVSYGE